MKNLPVDAQAEMDQIGRQLQNCDETVAILVDKYWNRLSFVANDPHLTAYHEGQRAVVGFLLQCLKQI